MCKILFYCKGVIYYTIEINGKVKLLTVTAGMKTAEMLRQYHCFPQNQIVLVVAFGLDWTTLNWNRVILLCFSHFLHSTTHWADCIRKVCHIYLVSLAAAKPGARQHCCHNDNAVIRAAADRVNTRYSLSVLEVEKSSAREWNSYICSKSYF